MTSTNSRLLKLEFVFQIRCDMKLGIELRKVSLAQVQLFSLSEAFFSICHHVVATPMSNVRNKHRTISQ
jgi:hypothetical protein